MKRVPTGEPKRKMSRRSHRRDAGFRILIAAGGTGGHIFPALAVAEHLRQKEGCQLLFVGAGRMEMELISKQGYAIKSLPVRGYQRGAFWKNVIVALSLLLSLCLSYVILLRFRPDVLFGTGGYVSFPVLWLGAVMGRRVLILEPNAYAGKSNLWLSRRAKAVCVSHANMERFFNHSCVIRTGTPLRFSYALLPDEVAARRHFGLEGERKTVLFLGGSLGARRLNECVEEIMPKLLKGGYQLIWQVGASYLGGLRERLKENKLCAEKGLYMTAFLENMLAAYGAASVVVARAGALTLAEIEEVRRAAILIPSPHVAEDHQRHNAEKMESAGMAYCVKENQIKEQLLPTLLSLLADDKKRKEMQRRDEKKNALQATQHVCELLMRMAGGHSVDESYGHKENVSTA